MNTLAKSSFSFLAFALIFFSISCSSDDGSAEISSYQTNLGVGQSANAILSDNTFDKLTIEIGYMQGFSLTNTAQQEVIGFLEEHIRKSQGIEIIQTEIPSQNKSTYSTQDLRAIENDHRQIFPAENELSIWVSIVNAKNQNESVVGVAYQNLSASLMGGTISDNSGGIGQASRSSIEATILMHELGHLLGLVNIGTPMVNDHQSNGNHCDNEDCLMYFAVETTDFFSVLFASSIPELDENCKLDLQQNGGR